MNELQRAFLQGKTNLERKQKLGGNREIQKKLVAPQRISYRKKTLWVEQQRFLGHRRVR